MKPPGQILRAVREARGLTIAALADHAGFPRQTLSQWERLPGEKGYRGVPHEPLQEWERALGVRLELVAVDVPDDDAPDAPLSDAQEGLLSELLRNLAKLDDHDAELIRRMVQNAAELAKGRP